MELAALKMYNYRSCLKHGVCSPSSANELLNEQVVHLHYMTESVIEHAE